MRGRTGWIGATVLALALTACSGANRAPPPARTPGRAAMASPPTARETRACFADLARLGVRYDALPDRDHGGGCGITGAVELLDIGVPVTGLKAMRCGLARAFIGWVDNAVAPAAYQGLGSRLVRIETFGTYACRSVAGTSRLSGHAVANAVDVSGFVLADGRRVTVRNGWRDPDATTQRFLDTIHRSACKRFGTVLSPDYNAAHADHLHLEDDHAGFCR